MADGGPDDIKDWALERTNALRYEGRNNAYAQILNRP